MMKKNWLSSLQVKIIAWSFVPTLIILSAIAWFTFYSYQRVVGDLAINQDWAIVQSRTQPLINVFFDATNSILIQILLQVDTHTEEPLEVRAQRILDETQGIDIFDGGVYFLDAQGNIVKTKPEQPELLGENWSDSLHFRFMIDHPGRATYCDLRTIESSGKDILCTSVAMNNPQGEFVGAAYYCFTIYPPTQNIFSEAYGDAYRDLGLGPNIYMVDGNQRVIFSPDPTQMGKDLSGEAYLQQLFQGETTSGRFQKGNQDVLVSYAPMYTLKTNIIRWNLIKEENWDDILQPTRPYQQLLLILLALGVIVPVVVTAYSVRHITTPIQKLIRASEQVAAGQFKQRIEVKTGDEIETLAEQFNLMSIKLEESYASLEKKVADRTRELAIMNSILSVASRSLDLQDTLDEALSETVEQMGFDAGAAFKLESDPISARLISRRSFEEANAIDLANRYASSSRGGKAAVTPEIITYETDKLGVEGQANNVNQASFQMVVNLPLSSKGQALGLFLLGRREASQLSSEEQALLSSLGQQVGVAMENALLYEQAEHTAITAERNRLARELHDAVTQTLFSANLISDVIPLLWRRDPEEGMRSLEELRQLTHGALAEMRTLLLEMRPESLERADIHALITQLADAFIGRVRVPVSLNIEGDCELTHEIKLVFYRVAQEALNNIAKHAGARQVELDLDCQADQLKLSIKDDGLGFDPDTISPSHLGVSIMRERANSIGADLKIESRLNRGTTIELVWKSARSD